jgi:hypothetical protein
MMEGWTDGKTGNILFVWILPFAIFHSSSIPMFQCSMFLVAAVPGGVLGGY